jgi:hypothetical protein
MTTTRPAPRCPSCFADAARQRPGAPCPACGWRPGVENGPPALPIGAELHDCYTIGRVLGQGGFGITYLARERNLAVRVAIKEFLPFEWAGRDGDGRRVAVREGEARELFDWGRKRFLDEARAVARFDQHPAVVSVKGFFEANGTAYLVMEYIEGMTLKDHLAKRGGPLPYREALTLLDPIMDALDACHRAAPPLLHRDIAPDNIYLTHDGRTKLIDFGAARQAVRNRTRLTSVFKRGYAPLEQQLGDGEQGPWTDVYALAATLYHCLAGAPPPEVMARLQQAPLVPPSRRGADIPPRAERALLRALTLRPEQRTRDIPTLRRGLTADLPARAPEPGWLGRNARRLLLYLVLPLLVGLLTTLVYDGAKAWWQQRDARAAGRLARDDRAFAAAAAADTPAAYRAYLAACRADGCVHRADAEQRIAALTAAADQAERAARDQAAFAAARAKDSIDAYRAYLKSCAADGCGHRDQAEQRIGVLATPAETYGQPPITPDAGTEPGRFVKLDAAGRDLPDAATAWSCVRDMDTGLVWEVKTDDGGLRDKDHSYTWYDPNPRTNGGDAGIKGGGECGGGARCDTTGYADAVNAAALCGWTDWRMPTREALRSLVDYGRTGPAIDVDYFPNTPATWPASGFWSASAPASDPALAWYLGFHDGYDGWNGRGRAFQVRLVRAGQ